MNTYQLQLDVTQPILAGHDTTFHFRPATPFRLQDSHERKIHTIIVSDDLTFFTHIHPVENGNSYSVRAALPHGGRFWLFADYVPEGHHQVIDPFELHAEGAIPASQAAHHPRLASVSGKYQLELLLDHGPLTQGHAMFSAALTHNGFPIDPASLDDYLGEKAHAVLIHQDAKNFVHVHPEVRNGKFVLHAELPQAGIYRAWIQFQVHGIVHTTDFVLEAKAGHAAGHQGHGHHGHGHHH